MRSRQRHPAVLLGLSGLLDIYAAMRRRRPGAVPQLLVVRRHYALTMNNKLQLANKGWIAVGLVVALYVGVAIYSDNMLPTLFCAAVAISTAGIAAFDSTHIHLRHYNTW